VRTAQLAVFLPGLCPSVRADARRSGAESWGEALEEKRPTRPNLGTVRSRSMALVTHYLKAYGFQEKLDRINKINRIF
jgi:hypothetical protein